MNNFNSRIARESTQLSSNPTSGKSSLRATLLTLRNGMSPAARDTATAAICAHLLELQQRHAWTTLAVFWPIRGEADLTAAYLHMASSGMQLALPVVTAAQAPLRFAAWTPGQLMTRDAFGVSIPSTPQQWVTPDAMLIPCVGFTATRIRLGYGGGFYDRTLAILPDVIALGIAFDGSRTAFDPESHDVPLQGVLTESGLH